jgi:outer membrane protein OmpA-like peptidoglycan-associated protein
MKKQIIIGLSFMLAGILPAQESRSYLHFDVGGGLNNLSYTLLDGTQKAQLGYTLNAAYSYFFTPHWGLQSGFGLQSFSALSTQSYLLETPDIDTDGDSYLFRSTYKNWEEQQHVLFIDVPLSIQYRLNLGKRFGLIGSGGAKISMPISATYKTTGGQMVNTGYYSQWNVELSNMPQHGFSTITDSYKGNTSLKPSYMAIADLGGTFKMSKKTELYLGAYINYGLNNILKPGSKLVYQPDGIYNGVFSSIQTSKVTPVSAGVKVGLNFRLGRKTPKAIMKDTITDSDVDGIPDYKDKCPGTVKEAIGFVGKDGCPLDTDSDGVFDYLDKCPNTPIEARNMVNQNGCPLDTDGDGVPDYLDKCPGTPKEAIGLVDQNGCPLDTDGDGIPDYLDKCPGTPKEAIGLVDQNGCPLDTDRDGIPDYLDKCPTIAGVASNNGCPEVKKEVKTLFKRAMQGIQFESGKYIIKPISFKILNDIAMALQNNPTYLIEIQGHTDNVGKPETNRLLSENRAQAVKTYLESKGVDSKRLTTHGYGDVVPLADNKTSAGRALNRRVEFIVSFERVEYVK